MGGGDDSPVLIELEEGADPAPSPAEAPPVAEAGQPRGQAMQGVAVLVARPRSRLWGWLWKTGVAALIFLIGLALWDFVAGLALRNPALGAAAAGLIGLFLVLCLAMAIRELAALARLSRVGTLRAQASRAAASNDLETARAYAERLAAFYSGREDTRWGRKRLEEGASECFEADTVLQLADDALMTPLDAAATREVEAAARQVATITALVPLALADVLAALTVNIRMMRRIAEIYGGRSGTLGAWRLIRAVIAHLVATGAVAVGDDLLGSLGGGTLLAKISRRFGEGLINGALTARVGVAAMEVCRPLPFAETRRPRVSRLVRRALTGLFDRTEA